MDFFKRIFRRRKQFKPQPKQLRTDGCKTTLTPTPDDAELAAQALLESRIYGDKTQRKAAKKRQPSAIRHQTSSTHDAQYYQELSDRIKLAREQEHRTAMRYVAYCEEKLTSDISHQPSDLADLERGLYQHQDTVDREGGGLLKRWQKCLALAIVKQMTAASSEDEDESTSTDNAE